MKFKSIYDAYLGTGLVEYRGVLHSSLDSLQHNDINSVRFQLQKLSHNLERFLSSTGLYVGIKSLPLLHDNINNVIRTLSNNSVLSFNTKSDLEEFIYNLLSAFGRIQEFCSTMLTLGF